MPVAGEPLVLVGEHEHPDRGLVVLRLLDETDQPRRPAALLDESPRGQGDHLRLLEGVVGLFEQSGPARSRGDGDDAPLILLGCSHGYSYGTRRTRPMPKPPSPVGST